MPHDSPRSTKFQVSLRSVLLLLTQVAVYLAIVLKPELLAKFPLISAGGILIFGGSSFGLMVIMSISNRQALVLLGLAVADAVGNSVGLFVTIGFGPFVLFSDLYFVAVCCLLPVLLAMASMVIEGNSAESAWLSPISFNTFVGCVGIAQLWVIVQAAASV